MFLHHHLSLRKIPHHNGSLNQFVADQMGCLMKAILLFVAPFFGDTLVDLAQADVPSRLLFAPGSFGPNLIELAIVPASTFETTNTVDLPLLIESCSKRLNPQIE